MKDESTSNSAQATSAIPPDDPKRSLTIAGPDDSQLAHICLVDDTYTFLITGKQTDGRYCLIDMQVPPGGGPAPHRHDFEELFIIIEGEIEFTFRSGKYVVRAGEAVNIPANAPHRFRNESGQPARMLCMCTPAGQEEFFMEVGVPVATRTAPPPRLSEDEQAALKRKFWRSLQNTGPSCCNMGAGRA